MFGQSKPVVFEPYGRRRSRRGPPRWLVLALVGIGLGAAGVVLVQERYLPPRLSAQATLELRNDLERVDAERHRLSDALAQTADRLRATQTDKAGLASQLATSRASEQRLHEDISAVIAAIPSGSSGASVAVRAGQFSARGGMLAYTVVLTSERAAEQPTNGVMKLIVSGQSARGTDAQIALSPVALAIFREGVLRGTLALPDGFRPRDATIQVQDRSGRLLGKRVMLMSP